MHILKSIKQKGKERIMNSQNRDNLTAKNIQGQTQDTDDANLDPISGQPGAHPVGTGIGAAGAGTAGTVIGAVLGGPVGAVVGAVVGSVAGGLAGKSAAEKINPTAEDDHWRNNYTSRPYVEKGATYEEYQYAYRIGYEGYERYGYPGQDFGEVESQLQRDYEINQMGTLTWAKAKYAVKDAWDRISASTNNI